jgi:hypothetical protein
MTFLAALRCACIDTPCVFDGPINGLSFMTYVEQFLVPTLRPGDIVILDNAPHAGGMLPLSSPQRKGGSPRHPRCRSKTLDSS